MAIDPNLSLQVRSPKIMWPHDVEREGMALRQLRRLEQRQALDLAKEAREFQGQQLLVGAVRRNSSTGPNGEVIVDHDKVRQQLTFAGYPDLIPGYDKTQLDIETAVLGLDAAKRNVAAEKAGKLGSAAAKVLAEPKENRAIAYAAARQQLVELGAKDLGEFYSPEIEFELGALEATSLSTIEVIQRGERAETARRNKEADERAAKAEKRAAEAHAVAMAGGADFEAPFQEWRKAGLFLDNPTNRARFRREEWPKLQRARRSPGTRIFGGRVWQYNPETDEYDIDLGASEGNLNRAARRQPSKELTRSQAMAALRTIQSDASAAARTDYTTPFAELQEEAAAQRGWDLDELNRIAGQTGSEAKKNTRIQEGYEYTFNGKEWVRGRKVE